MANLTLSIEDSTLRRARIRAIQDGTSVNARVREFLIAYAADGDDDRRKLAMQQLIKLSYDAASGGGLQNRSWTRDDLHER